MVRHFFRQRNKTSDTRPRLLLRHVTGHNRDVTPSNSDGNMFPSGFSRHSRHLWEIDKDNMDV